MKIPATWPGEKRLYEKQFYAVLRRRTRIIDIRPEEGELGYTSKDGNIHEAYSHPVMDVLDDSLQVMFRYGVFTHETLHQVFTSFAYLEEVTMRHRDPAEQKVISLFANLVEDPSIEYFASDVFGGEMLEALKFSIRHIYKTSPDLSESDSAFTQLTNALVMFGDMGLLKGGFTYPEAEEYFTKIAPEFNLMVVCPDPHARIDAAEKWMSLTRPLWKKEQEEQEDFMRRLQQLIDELTNGGMEGTGEAPERPERGQDDERSERRKAFAKALEEERENPEEKNGTDDAGSSDSDGNDSSEEKGPASDDKADEEKGEMSKDSQPGNDSAGHQAKKAVDRFRDDKENWAEEYSETAAEEIWNKVQEEVKALSDNTEDTLDLPVEIPRANGRGSKKRLKCLNSRISPAPGAEAEYAKIISRHSRDIRMLISSIRNLLRADYDDYARATSGRYALKRDLDHTTVKIFDKRREKKNIDDMAVMLLIDISGSMYGSKIILAREASAVLAETFAALNIPCYIMGFTADADGASVIHHHYVSWNNTKAERTSLVSLDALANNDDGYSIRYAAQVLKKIRSEHKILFVISDGAPACNRYRYVDGISDTAMAIQEAKKYADVFGIGIGMSQCGELKKMYAGCYVDVKNVSELTGSLAKQLKRVIRAWL